MGADILRIAEDKVITEAVLQDYISKADEIAERRFRPLLSAYENDYSIYHKPQREDWHPDNRVSVNFASYIVSTFEGYFAGNGIQTSSPDEKVQDYLRFLNAYDDEEDKNFSLSRLTSIYGRAYEIIFTDEEGEIQTAYISPIEGFAIYSESITPRILYFVRTYTDSEGKRHGSISDAEMVRYFTFEDGFHFTEEQPHYFGFVPAVEYVMNDDRRGIFEDVLPLINAYNTCLSEALNDIESFAEAYLFINTKIDEETIQFIRRNRIINVTGDDADKIKAQFLEKPSGNATLQDTLDRLETMIFTIAMVANVNATNFATSSGIALRYKLLSMSNLAKTKARKMKSSLLRRYRIIFNNPVSGMDTMAWTTIDFVFTENIPSDTADEAETAGKLSGIVSKRTQLSLISVVPDVDAELELIEKEGIEQEGSEEV